MSFLKVPATSAVERVEPAYLAALQRGGYCVRDDVPYAQILALLGQTEGYLAQPTAHKARDTISYQDDGYGSFGAHKEMLFCAPGPCLKL